MDLKQTVYALDSTTIDLCLSLFPWARFRRRKGAIKLHTLLDLRGNIQTFAKSQSSTPPGRASTGSNRLAPILLPDFNVRKKTSLSPRSAQAS